MRKILSSAAVVAILGFAGTAWAECGHAVQSVQTTTPTETTQPAPTPTPVVVLPAEQPEG